MARKQTDQDGMYPKTNEQITLEFKNVAALKRARRLLHKLETSRTITAADHRERKLLIQEIDEMLLGL